MNSSRRATFDWIVLGILIGLGLCAMGLVLYANAAGVGMNEDSVSYILAARNLLAGRGLETFSNYGPIDTLIEPMVHWPPFFSITLAGLGLAGIDPVDGARWLNAVLFGVNTVLAGWIVWRLSGQRLAATLGAVLMLASPQVVRLHAMAFSGPLFLMLLMTALLVLRRYLTGDRRRWLILAAFLAGLAYLTRYVGGALIALGGLAVLFYNRRPVRTRLAHAVLFGAVSLVPGGLWALHNLIRAGTASGRPLAYHPVGVGDFRELIATVVRWFVPYATASQHGIWLASILLVIALALAWLFIRKRGALLKHVAGRLPLATLLGGFAVLYMLLTLASKSFFDAYTPFDWRILMPVYVMVLLLGVGLAGWWLRRAERLGAAVWLRGMAVLLIALLAGSYLIRSLDWVGRNHRTGQDLGVAGPASRQAEFVARIAALPDDVPLASNHREMIYAATGRLAYRLPRHTDPIRRTANSAYEDELLALGDLLGAEGGVVAYFSEAPRSYEPSLSNLEAAWDICQVDETPEGAIYHLCAPQDAG